MTINHKVIHQLLGLSLHVSPCIGGELQNGCECRAASHFLDGIGAEMHIYMGEWGPLSVTTANVYSVITILECHYFVVSVAKYVLGFLACGSGRYFA